MSSAASESPLSDEEIMRLEGLDYRCPECGHYMAYDDGAYYCDCTHGETFNCVCKLALKRYPMP